MYKTSFITSVLSTISLNNKKTNTQTHTLKLTVKNPQTVVKEHNLKRAHVKTAVIGCELAEVRHWLKKHVKTSRPAVIRPSDVCEGIRG